jgi:two-component system, OmpR family, response regulator MprA
VRVLVVEDERKLAQVLASALQAEHYDVVVARTGEDGFFRANAEVFDLVVLDLMLPGRGGLEILQALRQRHIDTPVMILTARDGVDDRVLGLDLGADDYLVKPFALEELLARVRALLRRADPVDPVDRDPLTFADLQLDPANRAVTRNGRMVDLTRTEFELLAVLLRSATRVVTRSVLFTEVWGYDFGTRSNSLDVYIGYLRRKLEADGEHRLVHTVRGVGYVLREAEPGMNGPP